jgi:hypothetical protein
MRCRLLKTPRIVILHGYPSFMSAWAIRTRHNGHSPGSLKYTHSRTAPFLSLKNSLARMSVCQITALDQSIDPETVFIIVARHRPLICITRNRRSSS